MSCYLLWALIGYLSGSVMYAYWIPRLFCGVDTVQSSDDGNPGAANAFHLAGVPVGILALCCDLLKGAVPVYLAVRALGLGRPWFALVLVSPVAGHAFPVLNGFRGGKAIAVSFGALLGLSPVLQPFLALAAAYLTFSLLFVVEPHLWRSVVTFCVFAMDNLFFAPCPAVGLGCVAISLLVMLRHGMAYRGERIRVSWLGRDRK